MSEDKHILAVPIIKKRYPPTIIPSLSNHDDALTTTREDGVLGYLILHSNDVIELRNHLRYAQDYNLCIELNQYNLQAGFLTLDRHTVIVENMGAPQHVDEACDACNFRIKINDSSIRLQMNLQVEHRWFSWEYDIHQTIESFELPKNERFLAEPI